MWCDGCCLLTCTQSSDNGRESLEDLDLNWAVRNTLAIDGKNSRRGLHMVKSDVAMGTELTLRIFWGAVQEHTGSRGVKRKAFVATISHLEEPISAKC